MNYLRLRQICLVAHTLEPLVADLCHVLGLTVCHRDPGVERFGLHNALMRVGSNFIEVVAPLPDGRGEGTAATRHLARRGGDSGYMVILDCDELAPRRSHMATVGVREAAYLEVPGETSETPAYQGLQLHPRDTGGALLEINHTPAGDDLQGAYWPAGPHWQEAPDSRLGLTLQGVVLFDADGARLGKRWAQVLQRPLAPAALTGPRHETPSREVLTLDNATTLAFASLEPTAPPSSSSTRTEGLSQINLLAPNATTSGIFDRARARLCPVDAAGQAVKMGGVWWRIAGV